MDVRMKPDDRSRGGGLALLSLDGGGIRGLSALVILREIMQRIKHDEGLEDVPRPCEYFDLIGGTSTGGLIALMLGRLRLTVDEAINHYSELAREVFSETKWKGQDGTFKATKLENAIKKIIETSSAERSSTERMMDPLPLNKVCKTFVCAMPALNMAGPRLFRTYEVRENPSFNCEIWQAARATSAAPTFFKRICIGDKGSEEEFVDGGLRCNNPVKQMLEEAETVFGPDQHVACLVSIGTGQAQTIGLNKPDRFQRMLPLNMITILKGIATDCEAAAEDLEKRFKHRANVYFRFNVDQGMQNVSLAEWEKLGKVTTHTKQYLQKAVVGKTLDNAILALRTKSGAVNIAELNGTVSGEVSTSFKFGLKALTTMFTGRKDILVQLDKCFAVTETSVGLGKQRAFVLYGLGGAGKTQIALKFIDMCGNRFSTICLVDASSVETIKLGLEAIAQKVGIGKTAFDILQWLSHQPREWLLVFDNADSPTLRLRDWFPSSKHGNIIITSRNPECRNYAPDSCCEISSMEPEDAQNLLLAHAWTPETSEAQAQALLIVQTLGYLALAIVQAGSYISKSCRLDEYLEIYNQNRTDLLQHHNVQSTDDYRWTAFTTWEISWKNLDTSAQKFLNICAFLHFDGITKDLFKRALVGMSNTSNDYVSQDLSQVMKFLSIFQAFGNSWNDFKFQEIINQLSTYSLIILNKEKTVYTIHPVVHAWARDRLSAQDHEAAKAGTTQLLALSITWSKDTENYLFRKTLLYHIAEAHMLENIESEVAMKFALVYSESGKWKIAEKLQIQAVEIRQRVFGQEHPNTLTSINNLAMTYWNQGRLKEAEQLEVQVMEIRQRVLGQEHLDTLVSMNNLAATYWDQGRVREAEELEVQVMEIRQRVLGQEHSDTLTSMNNLASTYWKQGRLKEAEKLEVQAIEISQRVLGKEYPHTLTSMNNLAWTYWNQGRLKEAEQLAVQVMGIRQKVLSKEHPHTLSSMNNLALIYQTQGKWEEAKQLEIQVMEISQRVLGKEHPHTLTSMNSLAWTYWKQDRLIEAEQLAVQVMEISQRVLSKGHPHTLTSMYNLALIYQTQGKWEEAKQLEVQVMEISQRVLGTEHLHMLTSMDNLPLTYWDQGGWKEASRHKL